MGERMEPLFELNVQRVRKGSRDASQSLYRQIKDAILEGRLAKGSRLPPTRRSSLYFGVSRNTAAEIYEQLTSEGYLVTRQGSGTYVASHPPASKRKPRAKSSLPVPFPLNDFWRRPEVIQAMGFWQDPADQPRRSTEAPRIDFRPGLVEWRQFPFEIFRRVSAKQLRGLERKPPINKSPQGNQGNFTLRAAIAKHIAATRAVACQPADILVTSGAQQAFDLLARVLVTPAHNVVAIEDPGYPPMRVAFAAAGARLTPVAVDAEGLIVEQLPTDTRVISLCPSHQFPLGVTMSAARRQALIEFAAHHRAVIIEDDYDGEFRFEGTSLPALRTTQAAASVFYVGTFSKCMLPALRIGYIVAPAWAMSYLVSAKNCMDWHTATPIQTAVAKFISEGHLTRHVRSMRETYGARRQLLLDALKRDFSEWLEPLPSFYGMHLTALARPQVRLEAVIRKLRAGPLNIHSLERYFLATPNARGLVIGYGATEPAELARGLSVLRAAFR
jgi:GntR family transcriptional regulator/MocR family aminotransferase